MRQAEKHQTRKESLECLRIAVSKKHAVFRHPPCPRCKQSYEERNTKIEEFDVFDVQVFGGFYVEVDFAIDEVA